MATITITSPVDGAVVIYDPLGYWAQLSMDQTYLGREGLNKRVAKVNDWVIVPQTKQTFICDSVDEETLVPTLRDITNNGTGDLTSPVGSSPDTFRASFDNTSVPYLLSIDPRFFLYGNDVDYVRIYRGTDARDSTRVISVLYDNQGNFLSNNIPTIDVARVNTTGILMRAIKTCNTNTYLETGELITVVFYSADARVKGEAVLRVIQGSWIAGAEADERYITHISLQSPYASKVSVDLLEVPINVQVNALNVMGILHYSDGSMSDPQAIDGVKWKLLGLENFVGVWPSQKARLTLVYTLDPTEAANGAVTADGKMMTAPYQLITMPQNGAFSIKLSGYPTWNSTEQAYRLTWFMTDLNRQTMLNVTPYVYFNENSDVWDGKKLGQLQTLSTRINLRDISDSYPSFIHTQFEQVTLDKVGSAPGPNWRIAFDINQQPLFGTNLYAQAVMISQNLWRVNVRFGAANYQEWLERIYYDAKPIYDPRTEARAPAPTHMVIFKQNARTEVPIEQWNTEFQVSVNFADMSNIQIEFVRYEGSTRLTLAVVCMPVKM